MRLPRFLSDTILIVDTNVRQFTKPGFYLIRVNGNDLLVKIRQGIDGQFLISADDSLHEEKPSLDGVAIVGQAIYGWKGFRL